MASFNFKPLLFVLCFTALQLSTAKMGVFFQSQLIYPTTAVLKCLKDKNYQNAQLMVVSSTTGIEPEIADYSLSIKNAGLESQMVLAPCNARPPAEQVKDFLSKIKKQYIDMLWLTSMQNYDEDICQWNDDEKQKNCKLMTQYLMEFKKNGIKVGYASTQDGYNEGFGFQCKSMNSFPLYWSPQDRQDVDKSFDKYRPFGGWTLPSKKMLDTKFLCGTMGIRTYEPDAL